MKKRTILLISLIVILFIFAVLIFSNPKDDEGTIKIAYISALSGDAGVWGQSLKKGFDYGLSQYNQNEDRKYTFQAIYEDDACEATPGINAFSKVINFQGIKFITGTVCSNVSMAVSGIVNDNNVLYIASGATNPDVVKQGDGIFLLWPDDSYDAKAAAEFALNELSLKSFAIGHLNDIASGFSARDSFKNIIENNGGEVVEIVDYASSDSEFRTVATRMISKNPEAIYMHVLAEKMVIFVKQLRDLNYEGVILLYGPSASSEGTLEKISMRENLYYAIPDDFKQTDFWDNYKEVMGEEADSFVALGYDSFELIKDSIEACDKDIECAKEFILSLDEYETTRGTFGFDENGAVTQVPYKVIKVE